MKLSHLFALAACSVAGVAGASCDAGKPPFSFWHKARTVRVNGQSYLDITLENASRAPIDIGPIVFVSGRQLAPTPSAQHIACGAVARWRLPLKYNKSTDVLHVVYQRDWTLPEETVRLLPTTGSTANVMIDEALRGVDMDVLFEEGAKPAGLARTVSPVKASQLIPTFNGSYFVSADLQNLQTYAVVNQPASRLFLRVGGIFSGKGQDVYLTCLLNGRQVSLFNGKPVAKLSLASKTSRVFSLTVTGLSRGLNHFKCYSLNGLADPSQLGDDILNPNNIASVYIRSK